MYTYAIIKDKNQVIPGLPRESSKLLRITGNSNRHGCITGKLKLLE